MAEQRGTSSAVWLQLLTPALQTGPQGTYGRIKRLLFTFMHEHENLIYCSPVPRDQSAPALDAVRVKAPSRSLCYRRLGIT